MRYDTVVSVLTHLLHSMNEEEKKNARLEQQKVLDIQRVANEAEDANSNSN